MKECINCKEIWTDLITFCPNCGKKLTPARVLKCSCGEEYSIKSSYKYCITCGKLLNKPEVK